MIAKPRAGHPATAAAGRPRRRNSLAPRRRRDLPVPQEDSCTNCRYTRLNWRCRTTSCGAARLHEESATATWTVRVCPRWLPHRHRGGVDLRSQPHRRQPPARERTKLLPTPVRALRRAQDRDRWHRLLMGALQHDERQDTEFRTGARRRCRLACPAGLSARRGRRKGAGVARRAHRHQRPQGRGSRGPGAEALSPRFSTDGDGILVATTWKNTQGERGSGSSGRYRTMSSPRASERLCLCRPTQRPGRVPADAAARCFASGQPGHPHAAGRPRLRAIQQRVPPRWRDGRLWSFRDITDRKTAEVQIEQLAFYDPLTRLPNRRLVLDRLHHALAAAAAVASWEPSLHRSGRLSRLSTTRAATTWAICCSRRSPRAWSLPCARTTPWGASAATKSW